MRLPARDGVAARATRSPGASLQPANEQLDGLHDVVAALYVRPFVNDDSVEVRVVEMVEERRCNAISGDAPPNTAAALTRSDSTSRARRPVALTRLQWASRASSCGGNTRQAVFARRSAAVATTARMPCTATQTAHIPNAMAVDVHQSSGIDIIGTPVAGTPRNASGEAAAQTSGIAGRASTAAQAAHAVQ